MTICTIRDSVANTYGRPFFTATRGTALRSFIDMCNDTPSPDNPIAQHPEDYELFELGTFDDQTGRFDLVEPVSLALVKNCKVAQDS